MEGRFLFLTFLFVGAIVLSLGLGRLLYPDLYAFDLAKEVKDFYRLFLSIDLTDGQYAELMRHAQ